MLNAIKLIKIAAERWPVSATAKWYSVSVKNKHLSTEALCHSCHWTRTLNPYLSVSLARLCFSVASLDFSHRSIASTDINFEIFIGPVGVFTDIYRSDTVIWFIWLTADADVGRPLLEPLMIENWEVIKRDERATGTHWRGICLRAAVEAASRKPRSAGETDSFDFPKIVSFEFIRMDRSL